MEQMGAINVANELINDGVHCLENVMMLDVGIHMLFDNLSIWLKATVWYHFIALV